MGLNHVSTSSKRPLLEAVCFDLRGVILDHKTDKKFLPGMEELLKALRVKGLKLAIVSRFPCESVIERLGSMQQYFGDNIYSGGGQGKLDCIREFAKKCGISDLAKIAFVDDKPDNILPVAQRSDTYAIGFRGSGKYPSARQICKDRGLPFAESVKDLENLLLALL